MNMNVKGILIIEESFENLNKTFGLDDSFVAYSWKYETFEYVQAISQKHPAISRLWDLSQKGSKSLNKSCLSFIDSEGLSIEVMEDFLVALNYLNSKANHGITKH